VIKHRIGAISLGALNKFQKPNANWKRKTENRQPKIAGGLWILPLLLSAWLDAKGWYVSLSRGSERDTRL